MKGNDELILMVNVFFAYIEVFYTRGRCCTLLLARARVRTPWFNLTLVCQMDDPNLPCIPPISISIPPSYPNNPPKCRLSDADYDTTPFLKKVKLIMQNQQYHLPEICSITMLLDSWEYSVRKACSNHGTFRPDDINPLTDLKIFN